MHVLLTVAFVATASSNGGSADCPVADAPVVRRAVAPLVADGAALLRVQRLEVCGSADVDENGIPSQVVAKGLGIPYQPLVDATIEAMKQWRFGEAAGLLRRQVAVRFIFTFHERQTPMADMGTFFSLPSTVEVRRYYVPPVTLEAR